MSSSLLPLLTASAGVGRDFSKLVIFFFPWLKPRHGYSPGGETVGVDGVSAGVSVDGGGVSAGVDGVSVDGVGGNSGGGGSSRRFDLPLARSHSHLLSSPWW